MLHLFAAANEIKSGFLFGSNHLNYNDVYYIESSKEKCFIIHQGNVLPKMFGYFKNKEKHFDKPDLILFSKISFPTPEPVN